LDSKKFVVNEEIKAKRVVVIDDNGDKLGEFLKEDAISLAYAKEMDLVVVSEDEKPICRVMDFGKFLYDQKKKAKKNTSHSIETKEIQFGFQTEQGYIDIKSAQARKFLERGDKVKLTIKFSGRESSHLNLIYKKCMNFFHSLEDVAEIESQPKVGDRQINMILALKK
jgi:translation initiation factor IF-3